NQNVEMAIEIEVSAEGVWHHHNQQPNTIFGFHQLRDDCGSQRRQVVKQMVVLLKYGPENARHRKNKTGIRNIGKSSPLLPLPQERGATPATRTSFRLTSMVKDFLFAS